MIKNSRETLCYFLCKIDNLIFPQVIFCLVITNKIFFKIFQFFVTLCRIFIHSIIDKPLSKKITIRLVHKRRLIKLDYETK